MGWNGLDGILWQTRSHKLAISSSSHQRHEPLTGVSGHQHGWSSTGQFVHQRMELGAIGFPAKVDRICRHMLQGLVHTGKDLWIMDKNEMIECHSKSLALIEEMAIRCSSWLLSCRSLWVALIEIAQWNLTIILCLCLCICLCICLCLFDGQVMSSHHSDQMSQRSQVSRIALWWSSVMSLSLSLSLYLSFQCFFWSGHVSSSLWSNVSKVTSL